MANRKQFKMSEAQRRRRTFSKSFKRQKVQEYELGRTTIGEISKQYEVREANVYKWIAKFGTMKNKPERIVVETESDTRELLSLKNRLAELERVIGQKQILIDFQDKVIDFAEQEYGIDIKKKYGIKPFGTSGSIENNTPLV